MLDAAATLLPSFPGGIAALLELASCAGKEDCVDIVLSNPPFSG